MRSVVLTALVAAVMAQPDGPNHALNANPTDTSNTILVGKACVSIHLALSETDAAQLPLQPNRASGVRSQSYWRLISASTTSPTRPTRRNPVLLMTLSGEATSLATTSATALRRARTPCARRSSSTLLMVRSQSPGVLRGRSSRAARPRLLPLGCRRAQLCRRRRRGRDDRLVH